MFYRRLASCVALTAIALMSVSLGGCNRNGAQSSSGASGAAKEAPPVVNVGPPVTEEDARAFAESFEKAIVSGNQAAASELIDWDALIATSMAGIDAPENYRQQFAKGLKIGVTQQGSLMGKIIEINKSGGSYRLLRVRTRNKDRSALFRLVHPNNAGLNYHEFLLTRRPDGKVRAVDLYVFLSGENLSQTFRREYIKVVAQQSQGVLAKLVGADREFVQNQAKFQRMVEQSNTGKKQEALKTYRELSPAAQKEKLALITRLQAAINVDDAEYAAAIEEFRKEFPNDACVDFLSIDGDLLKKRYAEALADVDRVDKALGGDPYLNLTRAGIHSEAKDYDAAREDAEKLIESDPDDPDGYWSVIGITLKQGRYDDTLNELHRIKKKFTIEFQDMTTVPDYAGFVKSPQYKQWLKEQKAEKQKAERKQKAEKKKQRPAEGE